MLLPLACGLLVSCSLLFTAETGGEVGEYACGEPLLGTLAHFSVWENADVEVLTSRVDGETLEIAEVVKIRENALSPSKLDLAQGPSIGCGNGMVVESRPLGDFVRISADHDMESLAGVLSVDFWFQPMLALSGTEVAGLLSKDAVGDSLGDLTVAMFFSEGEHFIAMRLQEPESQFMSCSKAIAISEWHHVAISVGEEGAALYVDGELSENKQPTISPELTGSIGCGDVDTPSLARTLDFQGNENDWLWGATNFDYDPAIGPGPNNSNPANDVEPMTLDELRFRKLPFTASQAEDAYNNVITRPKP